jgi:hypothetical protein
MFCRARAYARRSTSPTVAWRKQGLVTRRRGDAEEQRSQLLAPKRNRRQISRRTKRANKSPATNHNRRSAESSSAPLRANQLSGTDTAVAAETQLRVSAPPREPNTADAPPAFALRATAGRPREPNPASASSSPKASLSSKRRRPQVVHPAPSPGAARAPSP